jgi:hypothetical protein
MSSNLAMNEDIHVVDDFLPPGAFESLSRFISKEPMQYGSRSNSKSDPHGHWSRKFVTDNSYNLADVSHELEENVRYAPLNDAWKFLRDSFLANGLLIRCYLNGYTYGVDGYFHSDSQRADEHTAIIYMNEEWEPDWAGETVFLDANGDIIKSVLPKKNRAVIFNANIQHAGRSVSRKCTVLRKALIYKTRNRRSRDFERLSVFLQRAGALKYKHRWGSLHDHLVRTFSILERRGFDKCVRLAGGLHSIYGTNKFPHALMAPEKEQAVIDEFGDTAAHLASLFSLLNRPSTLESPVRIEGDTVIVEGRDQQQLEVPRKIFNDLRSIECANLQDQSSLRKFRGLSAFWKR